MNGLLENLLIMSLEATLTGAAVLALRFFFRRLPKSYSCFLWLLVLFRLLCPVTVTTRFGLMPSGGILPQGVTALSVRNNTSPQDITAVSPRSDTRFSPDRLPASSAASAPVSGAPAAARSGAGPENRDRLPRTAGRSFLDTVLTLLWLTGAVFLASAYLIQYLRWRRCVRGCERRALPKEISGTSGRQRFPKTVWLAESGRIREPYVCGIFRPTVYLPADMDPAERKYILLHERMHTRHLDPLLRLLWQAALVLHWFNPFVWLALSLLQKDMEMYCDESVLRACGAASRQEYALTLLRFSMKKSGLPFPVAFGESSTESRVKHILKWRKPAFAASALAVLAIALASLLLLTDSGRSESAENGAAVSETGGADDGTADNSGNTAAGAPGESGGMAADGTDGAAASAAGVSGSAGTDGGTAADDSDSMTGGTVGGAADTSAENSTGDTGADAGTDDTETASPAEDADRPEQLLELGQRWASAMVRRDNGSLIPLLAEGEQLDELRRMDEEGLSVGWSSPWPWFDDYRINYASTRDEISIAYYAHTSDPRTYAWREVLTLTRTDGGYLVQESELQTDAVDSLAAFEERYRYESPQDYALSGTGYRFSETPLDCFAAAESAEALGFSCMADWYLQQESEGRTFSSLRSPADAAAWFLNLEGGTAETVESPWEDKICLRWRFSDGATDVICLCPMDAYSRSDTSSALWAVEDILEESAYREALERNRLIDAFLQDPSRLDESGLKGVDGIMQAEWLAEPSVVKLNALADGSVSLYGLMPSGTGLFLTGNGVCQFWDQSWLSPQTLCPRMEQADFDGDGQEEIAVTLCVRTGTGCHAEQLFLLEQERNGWTIREYTLENWTSDLAEKLRLTWQAEKKALQYRLAADGSLLGEEDFSEYAADREFQSAHFGDIAWFSAEGNRLWLETEPAVIFTEGIASGVYGDRELRCRVVYDGNGFSLTDFTMTE